MTVKTRRTAARGRVPGAGLASGARPAARLLTAHALSATAMSMPWPALLAQVWTVTDSDTWLGVAGAARLLPYVILSAAAGLLADRFARMVVVRWSAAARTVLLVGAAAALATDHVTLAVVLAILTVAAGTPAYPAAVAAMPTLAGERRARYTDLLVTAEVTAFVVGPAFGGVLLGVGAGATSVLLAAVLSLASVVALIGLDSGPAAAEPGTAGSSRWRTVLSSPGVPATIAVVAAVNFAESAASVGLLALSHERWGAGDRGFGIGTAALGFASMTAPLLGLLIRLRASLLLTGGGLAAAGVAPALSLGVGPLAVVGAAGTVVECVSTDVLQRSVPDHVRAFSLGLTDMVIVLAAMLGALVAPLSASVLGPVGVFTGLAVLVIIAACLAGRRSNATPGADRKRNTAASTRG